MRAALREAVALGWMTKAQSVDAIPEFTAKYTPRTRWLSRDEHVKLLDALEQVELPAGKNRRKQKLVKQSPRLALRMLNRRLWVANRGRPRRPAQRGRVARLVGIDLDAGVLANYGTKTKGGNRATPIPSELLVELRRVPEAERIGRVIGEWPNVGRELPMARAIAGKSGTNVPENPDANGAPDAKTATAIQPYSTASPTRRPMKKVPRDSIEPPTRGSSVQRLSAWCR